MLELIITALRKPVQQFGLLPSFHDNASHIHIEVSARLLKRLQKFALRGDKKGDEPIRGSSFHHP